MTMALIWLEEETAMVKKKISCHLTRGRRGESPGRYRALADQNENRSQPGVWDSFYIYIVL